MTDIELIEHPGYTRNDILLEGGMPRFLLYMKPSSHWADFICYEVMAWYENNEPAHVELYVKGSIKWDGCSHVYFGEESPDDSGVGVSSGYIHLCGKQAWKDHQRCMAEIYRLVIQQIPNYDAEVAE